MTASAMATIQRPVGPVAASTPKPLLRRPTLVRKRDDDDEAPPSSPGKRAKVTFDSDVEVRVVDENVQNIIHEEVRQAFTRRARGDSSGYLKVKDVYAQKDGKEDLSPRDVKHYTTALLANVGALNKQSSDLVHAVLSSDWLGREEGYVTLYVRLLANLVSAQGIFLAETIRMLVDNLTACKKHTFKLLGSLLRTLKLRHQMLEYQLYRRCNVQRSMPGPIRHCNICYN